MNNERKKKIVTYTKLKAEVNSKHQELIKKLKNEEELLMKKIDEEIVLEEK